MNDGVKGRCNQDRQISSAASQEDAQNQSAKKSFLDGRDNDCGRNNLGKSEPVNRRLRRIDSDLDQNSAQAEQRNAGDEKSGRQIALPIWIWSEFEIAHAAEFDRTDQRPEQDDRGNKKRAMEISFEVDVGQEWQKPVRGYPLSCPKRQRREQCADQNCRGEVNQ